MKLSVVIPFYFAFDGKPELLARAVASLRGHDELIVIGHKSESLPWALNRGIEAAHGEWVLVMNDDMYLEHGDLADLCHEEYVTHPRVFPLGGCICYPRWVLDDLETIKGVYDETFREGYFDDDDIFARLAKMGIERRVVESVVVAHPHPGTTLSRVAKPHFEWNKNLYEYKHGSWLGAWPEPEAIS